MDWNTKYEKEIGAVFRKTMSAPSEAEKGQVVEGIFLRYDKNHDGVISPDELLAFLKDAYQRRGRPEKAMTLSKADADYFINKLSRGRREFLTKEEFMAYLQDIDLL
jgi:Ca2+-binding EF-hand superfamily protein